MAFEIMKEILEAEQRAEEILKQASVEKETMKAQATQKSNIILSEAKKEAKKKQANKKLQRLLQKVSRRKMKFWHRRQNTANKFKILHRSVWKRRHRQ